MEDDKDLQALRKYRPYVETVESLLWSLCGGGEEGVEHRCEAPKGVKTE